MTESRGPAGGSAADGGQSAAGGTEADGDGCFKYWHIFDKAHLEKQRKLTDAWQQKVFL